jgi:GGDEF domain-containing protein
MPETRNLPNGENNKENNVNTQIESIEEKLIQKAGVIKTSFQGEGARKLEVDAGTLDEKLADVIDKIPDEAVRGDIQEVVQILKDEKVSLEGAQKIFDKVFNTNKALYIDNRPYVRMAKRSLSEHRMALMIEELVKNKELTVLNLRKIVRVNFDLNGLKPMNDLGGHEMGNEGLRIFSDILKEGKTTKWLEEAGFTIIPSSEGGDEFGMVISGMGKDRPIDDLLLQEIKNRYTQEVLSVQAGKLVDFKDKVVQGRLLEAGKDQAYIDQAINSGFEFRMSTSMGVSRLDQALLKIEVPTGASYKDIVRALIGEMFAIADDQALKNKTDFKGGLAKSKDVKDNILSDLIDRDKGAKQNAETIKKQEEEIEKLKEKNQKLNEERKESITKMKEEGLSNQQIIRILNLKDEDAYLLAA